MGKRERMRGRIHRESIPCWIYTYYLTAIYPVAILLYKNLRKVFNKMNWLLSWWGHWKYIWIFEKYNVTQYIIDHTEDNMPKKYILETNQQLQTCSQLTDSECSITAKIKTTYSWPFWSCLFSKPPYCFLSPRVNSVGSISKCAAIYGFKSASLPKRMLLRFRAISLSSCRQEEKKSRGRERDNRKRTVNNMIIIYLQTDGRKIGPEQFIFIVWKKLSHTKPYHLRH